jgi:hypothetical protein
MCRGRGVKICTVLGDNPYLWSRTEPLPLPDWFDSELDAFVLAATAIADGARAEGLKLLKSVGGERCGTGSRSMGSNQAGFAQAGSQWALLSIQDR